MRRALCALGEDLAPPTESPSDFTPPAPALYAVPCSRLTTPEARRCAVGYAIAADYWARHPYGDRLLPRIVWSVDISDLTWPNRIHGLDLPAPLLREAYERSSLVAELRKGGRPVRRFADLTLTELKQEARTATYWVGLEPVAACRSPYVAGLRAELVQRSQDGDPRHNEQERTRAAMIDLDGAGNVDFSRERGCTASQLRRLLARYRALHEDRGLSMRQAHRVMAREWGCSPKTIEALLADARRYERIQDVWEDYRDSQEQRDHAPSIENPPA